MPKQSKLKKIIEDKKRELTKLEQQKEKFDELPSNMKFAIRLHDELCTHNHTDDCSWHYEEYNTWNRYSHKKYLELANKMRATEIDDNTIIMILNEGKYL